jgi:soluble lytic murein transglycosylase-like protein
MLIKTLLIAIVSLICGTSVASPLGDYITIRYKKDPTYAEQIVREINEIGAINNLDPALLLAVAETESGFNKSARSRVGASGLMQIMPRYHRAKLKGRSVWNVRDNIRVGAEILVEYGILENPQKALKMYSGGARQYYQKVLAKVERLRLVTMFASNTYEEPNQASKFDYTYHKQEYGEPSVLTLAER